MCRIVGGINFDHENFSQDTLTAMTNSLMHGGPDGGGTLINENVGFGHRRLSIIDLSSICLAKLKTSFPRFVMV